MGKRLKNAEFVVEDEIGVCMWQMPDGSVLGGDDGEILSIQGRIYDMVAEIKLRKAAIYWAGEEAAQGHPLWMPGARKITQGEHDSMMERFLDGKIPDIADEYKQLERGR